MQSQFKRAVQKASLETSRYASAKLRKEARASDWPAHIVNSLKMTYNRDGFDIKVHDAYLDEANNLEYGTTEQQPSPAIRRTLNRMESSEQFFLERAVKHLGV